MNHYNNTFGSEWLNLMCELLSTKAFQSTRKISELLGIEDTRYKRDERGSMLLIPKNLNLSSIAINPDLKDDEPDKPITYLSFTGKSLNLGVNHLKKKFPNFELVNNTYDGGFQVFFHPVDNNYNFSAVACQVFEKINSSNDLKNISIQEIEFLFNSTKTKKRFGYTMEK